MYYSTTLLRFHLLENAQRDRVCSDDPGAPAYRAYLAPKVAQTRASSTEHDLDWQLPASTALPGPGSVQAQLSI
jgi:hypothetical protein